MRINGGQQIQHFSRLSRSASPDYPDDRAVSVVFTSMMLILHPRIGGPPTAAVIANSGWGLMGLGIAIAVLHVAALQFGSVVGLSLALMVCVSWNLGLWWTGRRKLVR